MRFDGLYGLLLFAASVIVVVGVTKGLLKLANRPDYADLL